MNKSELIEALSKGEDLPRTKAEEVVNVFFGETKHGCQAYTVDRYVSMMYRD